MKILFILPYILIVAFFLGCAGGADDTNNGDTNVENNCIFRNDGITIVCGENADKERNCLECHNSYSDCFSNPDSNGLEDDSLCLDVYEICLKAHECVEGSNS